MFIPYLLLVVSGKRLLTSSVRPVGLGVVATIDSNGRTIFVADAHRDDGKRFIVRSDQKLTAFLELERITHDLAFSALLGDDTRRTSGSAD